MIYQLILPVLNRAATSFIQIARKDNWVTSAKELVLISRVHYAVKLDFSLLQYCFSSDYIISQIELPALTNNDRYIWIIEKEDPFAFVEIKSWNLLNTNSILYYNCSSSVKRIKQTLQPFL